MPENGLTSTQEHTFTHCLEIEFSTFLSMPVIYLEINKWYLEIHVLAHHKLNSRSNNKFSLDSLKQTCKNQIITYLFNFFEMY